MELVTIAVKTFFL